MARKLRLVLVVAACACFAAASPPAFAQAPPEAVPASGSPISMSSMLCPLPGGASQTCGNVIDVVAGQLDADSHVDVAAATSPQNVLRLLGSGFGTFAAKPFAAPAQPTAIAAGDLK